MRARAGSGCRGLGAPGYLSKGSDQTVSHGTTSISFSSYDDERCPFRVNPRRPGRDIRRTWNLGRIGSAGMAAGALSRSVP